MYVALGRIDSQQPRFYASLAFTCYAASGLLLKNSPILLELSSEFNNEYIAIEKIIATNEIAITLTLVCMNIYPLIPFFAKRLQLGRMGILISPRWAH